MRVYCWNFPYFSKDLISRKIRYGIYRNLILNFSSIMLRDRNHYAVVLQDSTKQCQLRNSKIFSTDTRLLTSVFNLPFLNSFVAPLPRSERMSLLTHTQPAGPLFVNVPSSSSFLSSPLLFIERCMSSCVAIFFDKVVHCWINAGILGNQRWFFACWPIYQLTNTLFIVSRVIVKKKRKSRKRITIELIQCYRTTTEWRNNYSLRL